MKKMLSVLLIVLILLPFGLLVSAEVQTLEMLVNDFAHENQIPIFYNIVSQYENFLIFRSSVSSQYWRLVVWNGSDSPFFFRVDSSQSSIFLDGKDGIPYVYYSVLSGGSTWTVSTSSHLWVSQVSDNFAFLQVGKYLTSQNIPYLVGDSVVNPAVALVNVSVVDDTYFYNQYVTDRLDLITAILLIAFSFSISGFVLYLCYRAVANFMVY